MESDFGKGAKSNLKGHTLFGDKFKTYASKVYGIRQEPMNFSRIENLPNLKHSSTKMMESDKILSADSSPLIMNNKNPKFRI